MKFLYALLLLVLAAYLGAFALDNDYEVSRSQVIAASPEAIHAVIEDLHTWESWSDFKPPSKEGTTPLSEFKGPSAVSERSGAGAASKVSMRSVPQRSRSLARVWRRVALSHDTGWGRVDTLGTILLEPEGSGVRVTMVTSGEMQGHWWRYFSMLADKKIGPILWQSLEGLKGRFENASVPPDSGGSVEPNQTTEDLSADD